MIAYPYNKKVSSVMSTSSQTNVEFQSVLSKKKPIQRVSTVNSMYMLCIGLPGKHSANAGHVRDMDLNLNGLDDPEWK